MTTGRENPYQKHTCMTYDMKMCISISDQLMCILATKYAWNVACLVYGQNNKFFGHGMCTESMQSC